MAGEYVLGWCGQWGMVSISTYSTDPYYSIIGDS